MKYPPFPLHHMLQKAFVVVHPGHYWTKWQGGCTSPWELHFPCVNPCSVRDSGRDFYLCFHLGIYAVGCKCGAGFQPTGTTLLSSLVVIHTWHQRLNLHRRARVLLWWTWKKTLCCARQRQDAGFKTVFYTNGPPHLQFQPKEAELLILTVFQSKSPVGALSVWLFIVEFGGYFPRTIYSFSSQL